MALSKKPYFPKSSPLRAIRRSLFAFASFLKRKSLRSSHSFRSLGPWASLQFSNLQVPVENREIVIIHVIIIINNLGISNTWNPVLYSMVTCYCQDSIINTFLHKHTAPFKKSESATGKAVLPAVLIVFRLEHLVLVFVWGDVLQPLYATVTVLPTASSDQKAKHRNTSLAHSKNIHWKFPSFFQAFIPNDTLFSTDPPV